MRTPFDTQHVERVQLASSAARQRAGLHDQRRVAGDPVALGGVADVTHVQMPGQEQVRARRRQPPHRHRGAADQVLFVVSRRQIERMVRDDDPDRARGGATSGARSRAAPATRSTGRAPRLNSLERVLFSPTTAISSSANTGARSPVMNRGGSDASGSSSRAARLNKRHVVIAGHHERAAPCRAVEPRARPLELTCGGRAGSSRRRSPPGPAARGRWRRCSGGRIALVERAEMQVREVHDRPHAVACQRFSTACGRGIRGAALLVAQIWPIFLLLAPCPPGAAPGNRH